MAVDGIFGEAVLFSTLTVAQLLAAEQTEAVHHDVGTLGVETAARLLDEVLDQLINEFLLCAP